MERANMIPLPGRGAVDNPTGRFEAEQVLPFDDEWGEPEPEPTRLPTVVRPELTRTIITRNDSPDVPFDRSINPYRGCEHGCIYCFARPTHAFLGLSPGLDFETRITSKPEAADLLRRELRHPGHRVQAITLGANTDPYQPAERHLELSRQVLEVMLEYRHPVEVLSKSTGVLRDLDLLVRLARRNLVRVGVTITTLDPVLARRMEPRAALPARRLQLVRRLSEAGVPVGVQVAPVIPGLTDPELERILEASADAGARHVGLALLRLPLEVAGLFERWLEQHYPLQAGRVMGLVRGTRQGALYDSRFGTRLRGTGPWAEALQRRFELARRRLGLEVERPTLATGHFRVPPGDDRQLALFPAAS